MINPFKIGARKTFAHKVDSSDLAAFETGTVHQVYSTFALGRDAEWACRLFVLEMKEEDEEGIGTFLLVHHESPALIGSEVLFTATLVEVNKNEVVCSFEAHVGNRRIAFGEQKQKIVKKEKLKSVFSSIAQMPAQKNIANNRKASYNYEIVDKIVAGVELTGTEVKSLRNGNVNFGDAFCQIHQDEMFVKSLSIPVYDKGNIHNHEPLRSRKLLLRKAEIKKLDRKVKEKGLTLIPTRLYFSERGWVKIEVATAKGKKTFDKRESIKQKDLSKQMKKIDY